MSRPNPWVRLFDDDGCLRCGVRGTSETGREEETMSPTMTGNVLNWASDIEPDTLEQASRVADMPFIHRHLALMADAHRGAGSTIGSVIATKGAVIPSAVGVDLGCGISSVLTPFTSNDLPDNLDGLLAAITQNVPAGVGQGHQGEIAESDMLTSMLDDGRVNLTAKQEQTAWTQAGTLGSGNHFVEIDLDETDRVWIVLHSGSRGIGNQLASAHIENAKGLMRKYFIDLPDPDLAYLVEGTPEFGNYISAMLWAQDYAALNRTIMIDNVCSAVETFLDQPFTPLDRISCHHNFCEMEHHGDTNVWVTRKGAVRARVGDRGIIPGSMGTETFIVNGLGNPASYNSCSHGAGRRMSRSKARKTLDVATFEQSMEGKTWNAAKANQLLDEDPRSYKDIRQVMADQADLVEIQHTLHQILNYKGL